MSDRDFERDVLTHFASGYNLARWLTGNDADADDVMQEAILRAHRFFAKASPVRDPRAWLLRIVRNTSNTLMRRPELESEPIEPEDPTPGADERLISAATSAQVTSTIAHLPEIYREVIVLRELEALTYAEIAAVVDAPEGTIMSRLMRGRALLKKRLVHVMNGAPE